MSKRWIPGTIARLFVVAACITSACIDADERTLNGTGATAGGDPAGGSDAGNANAGTPAGGGVLAGGSSDRGGVPSDAGQAGQPMTDGGSQTGGDISGGAGGAGGAAGAPVDEGIVNDWALWSIPNSAGLNLPNAFNYDTDDPDVTVDQVTGLSWQAQASGTAFTFAEGEAHCESLELGGYDDWRVPKRMELVSLVDYSLHDPAIDAQAFPGTKLDYYWTSTITAAAPDTRNWQVDYTKGFAFPEDRSQKYYVRCVRGKTKVPAEHYTKGTGSVTDNYTRLMWEMPKPATALVYDDAKFRCDTLALGGFTWRLPSIAELQSLIDHSAINPAIDASVFTDVPAAPVQFDWSSTAASASSHWIVQWSGGVLPSQDDALKAGSRCVRLKP